MLAATGKRNKFIVLVSYTSIQGRSFSYAVTEGLGKGKWECKCVNKVCDLLTVIIQTFTAGVLCISIACTQNFVSEEIQ